MTHYLGDAWYGKLERGNYPSIVEALGDYVRLALVVAALKETENGLYENMLDEMTESIAKVIWDARLATARRARKASDD